MNIPKFNINGKGEAYQSWNNDQIIAIAETIFKWKPVIFLVGDKSSLILFLILSTAFIKNSTKRIDDEIFTTKEKIRDLKKDFENIKLEHDYLSSAEKLVKFKSLYFENELVKKQIQNIKMINKISEDYEIKQFKFTNEK